MVAIWSILIFLVSNLLVWGYAAAFVYGSWLFINKIRDNRSFSNATCQIIVGAVFAVGLFASYYIMNFLQLVLMPISGVTEDTPGFALAISAILNLLTLLVVPLGLLLWTAFAIIHVATDRCPKCNFTKPAVLNQAFRNVVVKTTKTTKYSDGSKKTDVSYEDMEKVTFTKECPECGHVWQDEGLRSYKMH